MFQEKIWVCGDCQIVYDRMLPENKSTLKYECPNCLCQAFAEYRTTGNTTYHSSDKNINSTIILYEKKREAPDLEFKPCANERLVWLIDFISNIEDDKDAAKIRIDALFNGEMINTDISSFIIKV